VDVKNYITPQGVIVIVKGVVYVECEKFIATSKYLAKIKEYLKKIIKLLKK